MKQNVGGFILNGCAGGSITHDFFSAVYSFRMVNGEGEICEYKRCEAAVVGNESKNNNNDDDDAIDKSNEYWGAVVSMGLCGIMTQCTFQCIKHYNIIGGQTAISHKEWSTKGDRSKSKYDNIGKLDLKASDNSDPNSLYSIINNKQSISEYLRFYWYPQSNEDWIILWKGHRENYENDSKCETYIKQGIYDKDGNFKGKRYSQLSPGLKGKLEQCVAKIAYDSIEHFIDQDTNQVPKLLQKALDAMMDEIALGDENPQCFGHKWHLTLPMDQVRYFLYLYLVHHGLIFACTLLLFFLFCFCFFLFRFWKRKEIDNDKIPTQFTELFVDLEDCTKAMNLLWKYFEGDKNFNRKGTFAWEFYCARKDYSWIRPNYGKNCFRLDSLWFDTDTGNRNPYDFYLPLWNYLAQNGLIFKPHWGKFVPKGSEKFPQLSDAVMQEWGIDKCFENWNQYYQWLYREDDCWNKFINLIKKNDPNGVFLTPYWNDIFFLGTR